MKIVRIILIELVIDCIAFLQENDCFMANREVRSSQVKNAHIKRIDDGGQSLLPRSISHNVLNPDSSPYAGRHYSTLPVGTLADSPQISRASNIALRTSSTRYEKNS